MKVHRVLLLLLLLNCIKIPPNEVPVVYWEGLQRDAVATPIVIVSKWKSLEVIEHEKCHIQQMNTYGSVGFLIINAYYLHKYGYDNNPFEVQAYGGCQ
jgi:hypothetical protein